MSAEELLAAVHALGVSVQAEGDALRFQPGSSIPPALVAELREHKAEIIELVSLEGWPEASREYVRRFRVPEARLYPFLGKLVATPLGRGRLLQVFPERAAVVLDTDPSRLTFLLPSEVRPPDLTAPVEGLFSPVH